MTTIAERLVASYDRVTDADRDWLVGQGVPPHALDSYPGPIGADGDGMFTLPIRNDGAYSDLMGIAAWSRRDPSRCLVLESAEEWDDFGVFGLGQHLLDRAALRRISLAVTANPLEWLRRHGATFCPLHWPDAVFWLMSCPQLVALPAGFGHELRRKIGAEIPRMPAIRVQA